MKTYRITMTATASKFLKYHEQTDRGIKYSEYTIYDDGLRTDCIYTIIIHRRDVAETDEDVLATRKAFIALVKKTSTNWILRCRRWRWQRQFSTRVREAFQRLTRSASDTKSIMTKLGFAEHTTVFASSMIFTSCTVSVSDTYAGSSSSSVSLQIISLLKTYDLLTVDTLIQRSWIFRNGTICQVVHGWVRIRTRRVETYGSSIRRIDLSDSELRVIRMIIWRFELLDGFRKQFLEITELDGRHDDV